MKVCVYGLGAVGGLLAARLGRSGAEVSAVARGRTLAAVRERGLTLTETSGEVHTVAVRAAEEPAQLGPQDVVILAVKTTALPEVAPRVAPLLHRDTVLLPAVNGLPWWFFHGLDHDVRLETTDPAGPHGRLSELLPVERVLGCVLYLSASVPAPGTVRHGAGEGIVVGEPTGGADSARLSAVVELLRAGGFSVEASERVQRDVWYKLWGNMTMNPLSAVTGATLDRLVDEPGVRAFASACMREAAEVGTRVGLPIPGEPEERHAVSRQLGAHRTSMLQDAEAGRPLELDALLGSVAELARATDVPTPHIDTLLGMARLFAASHGLGPATDAGAAPR